MPTKTTEKKTRKPTQLDRIIALESEITYFKLRLDTQNRARDQHKKEVAYRFAAIESRLPAPEPKEPEPWVPKVGDWAVCDKRQDNIAPGWVSPMDLLIGKPMRIQSLPSENVSRSYWCEDWAWRPEWLRPATKAEIDAHLEAERKAEEMKLIEFGTRVKVKGAGGDGIYWCASGDKHKVVFDCGGFLVVPRHEITVNSTKP